MKSGFKVLFLASWYPIQDDLLTGIFIKRHARAISQYCDVVVLSAHVGKPLSVPRIEHSIEENIPTIRLYCPGVPLIYRVILWLLCIKGLFYVQKELKEVDIIHLNVIKPMGFAALMLNKVKKIPFVLTEHSSPFSSHLKTRLSRTVTKIILKNAAIIMPVSKGLEEEMRSAHIDSKYRVIPNIVDTDLFFPSLARKYEEEKKKILHVSRLADSQKNISGLLKGIKELSEKRGDFELHIVGDGEDRIMLEELAYRLGIQDKFVYFHGSISDKALIEHYRTSNFFVLNSNHETFAIVCAEALAFGIPVISTRCGGPEYYINEEVGILIEPKNIQELVDAMNYMLDNNWRYDPKKLHEFVKKRFSHQKVGKQIHEIYKEILKEWKVGSGGYKVKIESDWFVADIGSGDNPHRRADILVDREMQRSLHRSGEKIIVPINKPFVMADACYLPFKDNSFDFMIASHIAEHLDDPENFCKELMRVGKRGYIETPGILTETCLNEPYHQWNVHTEQETLIFERKIRYKPLNDLFYNIYYYGEKRYGHSLDKFGNVKYNPIPMLFKWILNRIWKTLPNTYTCYPWEREIKFEIRGS